MRAFCLDAFCAGDDVSAEMGLAAAHTPETRRRLEQIAAASQSGRAMLLEGPTCSGKTQLVRELARLAGYPLVVINLTAETGETGEST
jgi:MoxR-like ATPase